MGDSVNLTGVFKDDEGLEFLGMRIVKPGPDDKCAALIKSGDGKVRGRLWGRNEGQTRGPKYTGTLGMARVALWPHQSDKAGGPVFMLSVERPRPKQQGDGGGKPDPEFANDDIPF